MKWRSLIIWIVSGGVIVATIGVLGVLRYTVRQEPAVIFRLANHEEENLFVNRMARFSLSLWYEKQDDHPNFITGVVMDCDNWRAECEEVIDMLLSKSVDIEGGTGALSKSDLDREEFSSPSPLQMAVYFKNISAVKFLLSRNANVLAEHRFGRRVEKMTALQVTGLIKDCPTAIVDLLTKAAREKNKAISH
jgi:hypothetical protein